MLLRIDDIVSGIKKKQAPGAGQAPKPKVETEGDADNEQILPDWRYLHNWTNNLFATMH